MEFLKFNPVVYAIGDEYEIALALTEFGRVEIRVGDEAFFEDNNGVLPTQRVYAKIRIPQSALDSAKSYTVVFRKTLERKNYWSTLDEAQELKFNFKPVEKTDNINIYHISDVHQHFETGKKIASYFGDDIDLYVFNGDIGEVQTDEDYVDVCRFVSEVSGGRIPVIYVRGNHDTRGYLPEKYTDYLPADGKNTFFTVKVGSISAIVLDLGEDKPDEHIVYGGFNDFYSFRRKEDAFIDSLVARGEKFDLAICHIPPAFTAKTADSEFNIECELYEGWNKKLSQLGVKAMLSGHLHELIVLNKNDERSLRPHDFPIIIGALTKDDYIAGGAYTLSGNKLVVKFTDAEHNVLENHEINLY